jgi:hypothetical protein
MHGYRPGSVALTTEMVLSHKHHDDRARVSATIADMIVNRVPFRTRHRIVDTAGTTRHVIVVGDLFCDDHGEVVGTSGFYVDVTPTSSREVEDDITAQVTAITKRRGAIEQTKGMLMFVYDISEDAAFNILKSLSQVHNVKLGRVAEQIATDFRGIGQSSISSHAEFDRLLFTAPQRAGD